MDFLLFRRSGNVQSTGFFSSSALLRKGAPGFQNFSFCSQSGALLKKRSSGISESNFSFCSQSGLRAEDKILNFVPWIREITLSYYFLRPPPRNTKALPLTFPRISPPVWSVTVVLTLTRHVSRTSLSRSRP